MNKRDALLLAVAICFFLPFIISNKITVFDWEYYPIGLSIASMWFLGHKYAILGEPVK